MEVPWFEGERRNPSFSCEMFVKVCMATCRHRPNLAPDARWKTAILGLSSPWLCSNRSLSLPQSVLSFAIPDLGVRTDFLVPTSSGRTPAHSGSGPTNPIDRTLPRTSCIKRSTTPQCGTSIGLVSLENVTRPHYRTSLLIFWSKSRVRNCPAQCTSRKRGFAGIKLSYVHLVIRGVYLKVLAFASGPKNRLIVVAGTHLRG